jgi:hypothetical protein
LPKGLDHEIHLQLANALAYCRRLTRYLAHHINAAQIAGAKAMDSAIDLP